MCFLSCTHHDPVVLLRLDIKRTAFGMRIFILKLQSLIASPVAYAKGGSFGVASKLSVTAVVNVAFAAL